MSYSRRRRKKVVDTAPTNVTVKQEPIEEGWSSSLIASKVTRKRPCKSQAVTFPVKIKQENIEVPIPKGSRNRRGGPVSIKSPPPGSSKDDGSLKVKFILSPKRDDGDYDDDDDDDEEEDEDQNEEEEEVERPTPSSKSRKGGSSKKSPGNLKLKFSFKNANIQPPPPPKGKNNSIKRKVFNAPVALSSVKREKEDTFVHPKKRFRTTFEATETVVAKSTSVAESVGQKVGKSVKLDSDSGYSDAQSSAHAVLKMKQLDTSSMMGRMHTDSDKKREKKKKKRDKDKKKKFFKTNSDKNRFLNVHRSSDEMEDGWIEEKVVPKAAPPPLPIEYEIYNPGRDSPELVLQPIKVKREKKMKSKSRSKSKSRRKHGKKSKRLHHVHKKKRDKQTFTQEQIVKIQQRLMLQGMKSPSSGGDNLVELNFSSHGEDLISQLTASSGTFDPISLLEESPEELVMKPSIVKHVHRKMDKGKLKDKKKRKKMLTAYMMWCKANRAKVVATHKGFDFAGISRKLGELWLSLPEKEKMKWKQKQRALMMRHKNLPSLSRMKKSKSGSNIRQFKFPPPHTDPIDAAAHLKLLGESLENVGKNLISHDGGEAEVHGSMSVLMDSMLSALAPLLCLTSQVDELNAIYKKTQAQLLENIAYIMPGL